MQLEGRTPLYLAIGLAALAALLAWLGLAQKEKELRSGWDLVPAVVAKRAISEGETLTADNVTMGEIPERFFTNSVVGREDSGRILGRRASVAMNPGDPVLLSHIASTSGEMRLADVITKKGRAISIRVSPESAVHHWIRPSDHVDVIATFRDPTGNENVTMTLLENVIVLATGQIMGLTLNPGDRTYTTVTLQVVPEAAEMLILAQELGSLYLTLRHPEDGELQEVQKQATTLKTIVGGERARLLSKTQAKTFQTVEVIRGGKGSEVKRFPTK